MATRKYAENLIGNWETSQYEPQRQVVKDIYQTNWNKLTNDLNTLNEQLSRNFERARQQYTGSLQDTAENSFRNMYNAETNLANRGLATSGLLNNINQANIANVGNAVNTDLENLLNSNRASIEGSISGLNTYGSGLNNLANNLSNDLGGITDSETKNLQNYYDLISNLTESANSREARNASARASLDTSIEDEEQEYYRRQGIMQTLASEDLTDTQKATILVVNYDVPIANANILVGENNQNALYNKEKAKYDKYMKSISDLKSITTSQKARQDELMNNMNKYTYNDLISILNDTSANLGNPRKNNAMSFMNFNK